ncbi:MAG: tetratricopeptide repeat protein [bacterium]|nr:tetratricopeptide repeat protein [bacterium]
MARNFRKSIKSPDVFQTYSQRVLAKLMEFQRQLILAGVAIIIALGAYGGYWFWEGRTRRLAALAYGTAVLTAQSDAEQMEALLRAAAEKYPGTRPGILARLELGALLLERNKPREAEKTYREALAIGGLTETDRAVARRGLAGAMADQGKCDEARGEWRQAIAKPGRLITQDIYLSIAACFETQGKPKEALKVYEELSQKHPRSPFLTADLRDRIRKLGGQ